MDWIGKTGMETLKKYRYVFLVVLVGIFLMALPEKTEKIQTPAQEPPVPEQEDLQRELSGILAKVAGAGRVEVLLTYDAGERTLYQTDDDITYAENSRDTRKKTVVVTGSSREETGLVSQLLPPTYRGAVILCQGADNAQVRLSIVEAVSNATGLSTDKISVLKMK